LPFKCNLQRYNLGAVAAALLAGRSPSGWAPAAALEVGGCSECLPTVYPIHKLKIQL
jgi:hypothetical protein